MLTFFKKFIINLSAELTHVFRLQIKIVIHFVNLENGFCTREKIEYLDFVDPLRARLTFRMPSHDIIATKDVNALLLECVITSLEDIETEE